MDAPVTEQFDKEHFIEVLEALHRDQTGLAAALNRGKDLIDSYDWIAESRGSYEWDDDEYMEEVGRCFDAIRVEIDYSLSHSGKAHQICCGKYRHVGRHDKVPLQRRLRMGQFYNEEMKPEPLLVYTSEDCIVMEFRTGRTLLRGYLMGKE